MPAKKTTTKALPVEVEKYVLTETASDKFIDLCDEFYFSVDRIQQAAELFRDVFQGKVKVSELPKSMEKRLGLDKERAIFYSENFAGKYLLVADDYFNGEVKKLIEKLGGKLDEYQILSDEYGQKIEAEIKSETEDVPGNPENIDSDGEEENPLAGLGEINQEDPQEDVKDMCDLMKNHLLLVFKENSLLDRVDYNIVLTSLFLMDKGYHHEILHSLLSNVEKLGPEKLKHKNETLEQTIGNWLKDFDISTREEKDEKISSLSKARYYNENINIKKLKPEEKDLLDKVFDLFENVKNFYANVERMELTDVQVFPFTDKEQHEFLQQYGQSVEKKTEESTSQKTKDIYELYMGDAKDREAMAAAEKEIIEKTNRDKGKLANWLYDEIIARHRINIIAGLKVAIETGLLDDYVRSESRFIDLLEAHYKRNNLNDQLQEYQTDRANPLRVKDFLHYILTERLGMIENHAARVALQFGNIYRHQGIKELAQLSYFDVSTQEFKWM